MLKLTRPPGVPTPMTNLSAPARVAWDETLREMAAAGVDPWPCDCFLIQTFAELCEEALELARLIRQHGFFCHSEGAGKEISMENPAVDVLGESRALLATYSRDLMLPLAAVRRILTTVSGDAPIAEIVLSGDLRKRNPPN
jgi:hypothetical protein